MGCTGVDQSEFQAEEIGQAKDEKKPPSGRTEIHSVWQGSQERENSTG